MLKINTITLSIFLVAFLNGCAYYKEPKGANVAYLAIPEGSASYSISDSSKIKWEIIAGGGVGGLLGFHYVIKKIDIDSHKTFRAFDQDTGIMIGTTCTSQLRYGIKFEANALYSLWLESGCKLALKKLSISLEELKLEQNKKIWPDGVDVLKTKADLVRIKL
jgi:hypothetical protein